MIFTVALFCSRQFSNPELPVAFRDYSVFAVFVLMPKTAVDIHSNFFANEDDIRLPQQL